MNATREHQTGNDGEGNAARDAANKSTENTGKDTGGIVAMAAPKKSTVNRHKKRKNSVSIFNH